MAAKKKVRGRPRKALEERRKKAPNAFRHFKVSFATYDELRSAMNGGGGSEANELVSRLEPGQSAITALGPMAFVKTRQMAAAQGIKLEIRKGMFVAGPGVSPITGTLVTRLT